MRARSATSSRRRDGDRALLGGGRHLEALPQQVAQLGEGGRVGGDDVDALLAHLGLELGGRAGGDLGAAVDQDHAVGQRVGLLQVLGGEQERDAVGHQLADRRPHHLAAAGIEPGGGLVEDEHVRGVDEAGGQVDAAPLAAGEVLDQAVAEAADVEAVDELVGERAARPAGCARAGGPSGRGSRGRSGSCPARRTAR